MKIAEVSARPPQLVQQLVEVWQRFVQATHLFCLRRKLPLSVLMFRRPCAGWNT